MRILPAYIYALLRRTEQHPLPTVDQHGVDFGSNCVHIAQCRAHNLCFGTCKLY